jgi:low affinity Fe/Cu permease
LKATMEPAPTSHRGSVSFHNFANWAARASGRPAAFTAAVVIVLVWAVTGPFFNYSDTWQLVINTGTTIVTFLMVFLIQNTQNRDTQALQLKLDELIRSTQGAHNMLLGLEQLEDTELDRVRRLYAEIAEKAKGTLTPEVRTGVPEVEPDRCVKTKERNN